MSLCLYVSWGDKSYLGFPLLLRYVSTRLLNDLSGKNEIHRGGIYQSVAHCGVSVGLLTLPLAVVITIPTSSGRSHEAMDYGCRP